jgi:hypothetical protein
MYRAIVSTIQCKIYVFLVLSVRCPESEADDDKFRARTAAAAAERGEEEMVDRDTGVQASRAMASVPTIRAQPPVITSS